MHRGSAGGLDRVEIGETINAQGDMRMGDVHVGPGYVYTDPSAPVSKVNDLGGDTAGCWGCHDGTAAPEGADAISAPLDNFGRNCVTDTDEPCQQPDVEDGNCHDQGNLEKKTFAEICQCLDDRCLRTRTRSTPKLAAREGPVPCADGLPGHARDLRHRRTARKNRAPTAAHSPRASTATPTSPAKAELRPEHMGYTCQEVAPGVKQCVSSRVCVDYSIAGGGKFIGDDGVSLLRLLITGKAAVDDCPICDSTDIDADISAFNHAADTLVNGVQITS